MNRHRWVSAAALALSSILWVLTLALRFGAAYGVEALRPGWFEPIIDPLHSLASCANPLLLTSLGLQINRRDKIIAIFLSLSALGFGLLLCLSHFQIIGDSGTLASAPLKVGYWVWLCSIALGLVGAMTMQEKTTPKSAAVRTGGGVL